MPSIGIPQYSSDAGLAEPTTATSAAVLAAIEYAGVGEVDPRAARLAYPDPA